MKAVYLIILLLSFRTVYAHNPDLSSLMIYEQDGKSILLIKSSLTAFEGEVDYVFGKGAYKTPEAFNQLVIQHFKKNCFVVANGDTIQFANIQVQLGHETNLFAELEKMPKSFNSIYVANTVFNDMPNNLCELILTSVGGAPQNQYILNNDNQHQVAFKIENDKWSVSETPAAFNLNSTLLIGAAVLLVASLIVFVVMNRKSGLAV